MSESLTMMTEFLFFSLFNQNENKGMINNKTDPEIEEEDGVNTKMRE